MNQPLPDGHAFNDHGQPEPKVEFDFAAVDGGDDGRAGNAEDLARVRGEAAIAVLRLVTLGDVSAEKAGRRAYQLLHCLRPEKTQMELADLLCVTQPRISQELIALRHQISNLFN